jgi:chromosome segregation ATPase
LDETDASLQGLAQQLSGALAHEEELLVQQNTTIDQLNALSSKVVAVHSSTGDSTVQLQHMREQVEPIAASVQQLENDESRPSHLVYHADQLNVPAVRAQVDNLVALLNEKQEDASARLALVKLASAIAEQKAALHDSLKSAQKVEQNNQATIDQLSAALENLDIQAKSQLAAVENAYDQLPQAPEADAVRTETLATMTSLGNNLKTLQAQLGDRLDHLREFDEQRASIENAITQIENSAASEAPQNGQMVTDVLDKVTAIRPSLSRLADDAVQLQPLSDPQLQTAMLQRRLDDIETAMQVRCVSQLNISFHFKYPRAKSIYCISI